MAEQFKVGVPIHLRVKGWIYDYDSGLCMGIASDEMKKKYTPNLVFTMHIAGCPHKVTIHG